MSVKQNILGGGHTVLVDTGDLPYQFPSFATDVGNFLYYLNALARVNLEFSKHRSLNVGIAKRPLRSYAQHDEDPILGDQGYCLSWTF